MVPPSLPSAFYFFTRRESMKPTTFVLRLWQRPDGLRLELMTPQGQREVFRDFEAFTAYLKNVVMVGQQVVILEARVESH
jgi:predicted lipoprotein